MAHVEAYRLDRGTLRSPRETGQGFLRVDGYATRVGVLEYDDPTYPDGIRRELRRPQVLFDAMSLAGYEGAPVTDDHPDQMVTASNASRFTKGLVLGPARRDGEHVAVSFQINDSDLIEKVRGGKQELSTGYRVEIDETPGVDPIYGRYDVEQIRIDVNHLAVVMAGRAGRTARVRMDSRALSSCLPPITNHDCNERAQRNSSTETNKNMPDDLKTEVESLKSRLDAAATLLTQANARADAAESKLNGERTRADTAEGQIHVFKEQLVAAKAERRDDAALSAKDAEIKTLIERADKAERALAKQPELLKAAVKARLDVERAAVQVLGGEFRMDDLTNRELMVAVLEKRGFAIEAERSDEHVRGSFQVAMENWRDGAAAIEEITRSAKTPERGDTRADTTALNARQARDQMVLRNRAAWRATSQ